MTNEIIIIIVIIIVYRAIIAQLSVNCYASFIEVSLINGAHIWDLLYIYIYTYGKEKDTR